MKINCSMKSKKEPNSIEHLNAEKVIFEKVKKNLGIELKENAEILVGSTYIRPDFYSENDRIIGEIFTHIGKSKAGQDRKVAKDILKMLLLEKIKGVPYKKMIIVCDKKERKHLEGNSMIAECIRQFDIEVQMIDIESDLQNALIAEQERLKMINTR